MAGLDRPRKIIEDPTTIPLFREYIFWILGFGFFCFLDLGICCFSDFWIGDFSILGFLMFWIFGLLEFWISGFGDFCDFEIFGRWDFGMKWSLIVPTSELLGYHTGTVPEMSVLLTPRTIDKKK